jgi:hypothetical protein
VGEGTDPEDAAKAALAGAVVTAAAAKNEPKDEASTASAMHDRRDRTRRVLAACCDRSLDI